MGNILHIHILKYTADSEYKIYSHDVPSANKTALKHNWSSAIFYSSYQVLFLVLSSLLVTKKFDFDLI